MKALVYDQPGSITWTDRPDPKIQEDTDIIMRVTTTTICGSDTHIVKGGVPDTPHGTILGHEGVGVVEEVGSAVKNVVPGDRILATCVTACASLQSKAWALLPGWAWTKACKACALRADTVTSAPCACSAAAVAWPMPLLAPSIHTVWPRQSRWGGFRDCIQAMA